MSDADLRRRGGVAMMAIFALEIALLGAFSGPADAALNFIMPILTGTAIALAFTYLGVRSLKS